MTNNQFPTTACLLSALIALILPPQSARAQRCQVNWQLDTPIVRCEDSPEDRLTTSGGYLGRQIVLKNDCPLPIRLVVKIQDSSDTWVTLGWWTIEGEQEIALSADNIDIKTRNPSFYLYAETTDGSDRSWFGNHLESFGLSTLKMTQRRFDLSIEGDYVSTIHCRDR